MGPSMGTELEAEMTEDSSEPTRSRVAPECAHAVSKPPVIIGDNRFLTPDPPLDNPSNL